MYRRKNVIKVEMHFTSQVKAIEEHQAKVAAERITKVVATSRYWCSMVFDVGNSGMIFYIRGKIPNWHLHQAQIEIAYTQNWPATHGEFAKGFVQNSSRCMEIAYFWRWPAVHGAFGQRSWQHMEIAKAQVEMMYVGSLHAMQREFCRKKEHKLVGKLF